MSEITIENYSTVTTVENKTVSATSVDNVAGTATVVETTPTETLVQVLDGTQNTIEVPAQNSYQVTVEDGSVFEVTTTTGPTGHAPVLFNGTAPPNPATGTVGDLYLVDSGPTIGDLYQKDGAGWGTPKGNLRGGIASVNGISGTNITIAANNITTGVLPIAQVPTGTTGTTVALGNHLHTGVYEPVIAGGLTTQFWRGDKSWVVIDKTSLGLSNVPNVDTTNATNITSGTLAYARHPVGTTAGTLAIGDHNHDTAYVSLATTQNVGGSKTFINTANFSAGASTLQLGAASQDHVYMSFFARTATPGIRSAYIGYGGAATTQLNITNEISNGAIWMSTTGTGNINLMAPIVYTSGKYHATGGLRVNDSATAGYVLTADALGNATWQQTANIIIPGTTAQYYRGDLSWQTLNAAAVGLGNVVNSVAVDLTTNQTVGGIKTFTSEIVGPSTGNVLKVGDDARIADVNLANAIAVVGVQNSALGGIVFGTNPTNWRIELVSAQSANITGNTQFNGSITVTNGVTVSAGVISGNGSGLTSLPATSLTGTIDILRLPTGTTGTTVALGNHAHTGVYEPFIAAGTTAQYRRGDKSWQNLDATAVGLGNVTNLVQVDLVSGQTITGAKVMNNAANAFTGNGAGLTSLNATQLTTGIAPQGRITPNTQRFLFTTGSEARPTGTTYVEWIGPVPPGNATNDDTWTDTSVGIIEDPVISMPVGIVQMWPTTAAPTNWLVCNGQAINRVTYAVLYALIGTTYGVGDGTSTFNLPNMMGRVVTGQSPGNTKFDTMGEIGGAETVTLTTTNLPPHPHTGTTGDDSPDHSHGQYVSAQQPPYSPAVRLDYVGDAASSPYPQGINTGGASTRHQHPFTTSGTTGANSTPVDNLQPYITLNYIIKVL